jgi:hypothetical protein
MISPFCERAIADCGQFGNAILKYISRNDVDATGGASVWLPLTEARLANVHRAASREGCEQ